MRIYAYTLWMMCWTSMQPCRRELSSIQEHRFCSERQQNPSKWNWTADQLQICRTEHSTYKQWNNYPSITAQDSPPCGDRPWREKKTTAFDSPNWDSDRVGECQLQSLPSRSCWTGKTSLSLSFSLLTHFKDLTSHLMHSHDTICAVVISRAYLFPSRMDWPSSTFQRSLREEWFVSLWCHNLHHHWSQTCSISCCPDHYVRPALCKFLNAWYMD